MVKRILKGIMRKCFIFNTINRPIIPFKINLLYYKRNKGEQNVGDLLSPILLDYLLKEKNISVWSLKTYRLALIGSIIQFIGAKTIVFGSGFLDNKSIDVFSKKRPSLLIKAVRGPLTAEALRKLNYKVSPVYGDPAILMPLFYKKNNLDKKYDYIIIPHFSKLSKYEGQNVISTLTNDWKKFIDLICESKFVISASLHGIILAETYGIPAIMLLDTETEDLFKYKDYYYSTGRKEFPIANNIEEALSYRDKIEIPNLDLLRKNLYNAFSI